MAVPIKEVEQALITARGIVTVAAQNLGISRTALHRRIQRNKKLQKTKLQARETVIDLAEVKLYNAINSGKEWAIKYALSRLGKSRGYTERIETIDKTPDKKQVIKIGDAKIEF